MISSDSRRLSETSYFRGALCGIGSAALFGASAPLAKRLLPQVDILVLAGLLYVGSGLGLTVARIAGVLGKRTSDPPLTRGALPTLLGVIFFGGVCGPALLLVGLSQVSAVTASLLLNLEGVFTALLAVAVFGERLNAREAMAIGLVLLAAATITYHPGQLGGHRLGVLAVAGACLCWGIDNNLTQRLSASDPVRLVQIKSFAAGPVNLALGLAQRRPLPRAQAVGASLVLGAFCYGASIVLDVYALRYLGAAREAAFFATAPFVGALLALPLLGERLTPIDVAAGLAMAAGVTLLVRAKVSPG